jgi:hypothetical protein
MLKTLCWIDPPRDTVGIVIFVCAISWSRVVHLLDPRPEIVIISHYV